MRKREDDLEPLAEVLAALSGVPRERTIGFAVVVAVREEGGDPGGRLITSTEDLRHVAMMLDLAMAEVDEERRRRAALS